VVGAIKAIKPCENRTDKNKCLSDIKHTDKLQQKTIKPETCWIPELKEILTVFW